MLEYTKAISKRIPLKDLLPLPMPVGLCIEPVNVCNFRCKFCPTALPEYKQTVRDVGFMDMGLYHKILTDIKSMGVLKRLNLYGDGEPLLNKKLPEMIRLALGNGVTESLSVTTNGSLLTEPLAEELVNSGLHYLRVSIYALNDEDQYYLTGNHIKIHEILNNIKKLRQVRDQMRSETPFIYVKMLDTYDQRVEEFKKLYTGIADQVNIETPMNWNGYGGIDLISQADPAHKTDETLIQGFYEQRGKNGAKRICTTPFHSLNIKVNGDVTICIVDWNKGTVVGNLKESSLKEVWFGERLRSFRLMHVEGRREENCSCKNCKYLYSNPDNIDDIPSKEMTDILNHQGN
jgi:radical SAM protein with 4Fe4S-binding SPASM domain